jgi:hypothetical protein
VWLKTTFGIAHQTSANAAPRSLSRNDGSVSTQHRLVKLAAAQIAAELAYLRDVETKLLLVRVRPPERALPVGDEAVRRDAHRVNQHGFKLVAAERSMMIMMTFTFERDTRLSF